MISVMIKHFVPFTIIDASIESIGGFAVWLTVIAVFSSVAFTEVFHIYLFSFLELLQDKYTYFEKHKGRAFSSVRKIESVEESIILREESGPCNHYFC